MIETIRTVRGILVGPRGVLVADRARDSKHNPGLTEFLGGAVEPGESLHRAAQREIGTQEAHVGFITLSAFRSCVQRMLVGERQGLYEGYAFIGRVITPCLPGTDTHEMTHHRWIPTLDQLFDEPLTADSAEIVEKFAAELLLIQDHAAWAPVSRV